MTSRLFAALAAVALLIPVAQAQTGTDDTRQPKYYYPTSARADYVIGCIAANGFQHQFLSQCSCAIDVIADRLSYADYETAQTVLEMQQAGVGPRGGEFRDTPVAKDSLQKLRRAEAEAYLRCGN